MSDRNLPVGVSNSETLVPFEYGDDQIRTVVIDGEPWFVAADVCTILGHTNPTVALRSIEPEDSRVLPRSEALNSTSLFRDGRVQSISLINEPGLYMLIMRSNVPGAKPFRRWITSEVLPSIRKTGSYGATLAVPAPPTYVDALRGWAAEIEARETAEALARETQGEFDTLMVVAREMAPAASAWEKLVDTGADYSVNDAAKILQRDGGIDTGQRKLMNWMREHGWVNSGNVPYQEHIANGRLAAKGGVWTDERSGDSHSTTTTRVTFKGLQDLHRLLSRS